MIPNLKYHLVAISAICAVITFVYTLNAPEPAPPPIDPELVGDNAVAIFSATWGLECNTIVEAANAKLKRKMAANPSAPPLPLWDTSFRDNVLMKLGAMCNGRNTCEIAPTNIVLESRIVESCAKKLDLSYRCFSYDRLNYVTIAEGETKKIDCNAPQKPASE